MPVSIATLNKNYQQMLEQNPGAEFIKVDLHIHTPASGDAQWKSRYNFKFDMKNRVGSLDTARQIAEKIVDGTIQKGIRVIAITDHNSPSNTHPENLTDTWYGLIKEKAEGKNLTVLPGVEISTDDLHILIILNPKEDEPTAYTTHRINFLLLDCGFRLDEYGDLKATGTSSLFDVLQYIEDLGTNCIAIPAHIDGGNKAMLEVYKEQSNVYNKLLNHPNLNAVEIVSPTAPTREKLDDECIKDYFERLRDDDRSPIAFIQDSDAHSIPAIGGKIGKNRFTYMRMGEPDFWALRNALENPETRIRIPNEYEPEEDKTRIAGIAYSTGGKWKYIRFNPNLNCVIGKKRTNKTTIIDLILYGLKRFDDNESDKADEKALIKKRYSVNVFIERNSQVLCYSRDNKGNPPQVYKYEDNSFTLLNTAPDIELPKKYNHQAIEKEFSQSTNLMDFLDRHVFSNQKIEQYRADRKKHVDEVQRKNFTDCAQEMKQLVQACQKLYEERKDLSKKALQIYGKDLFKVDISKGKYQGTEEKDYYDKATLSLLVDAGKKKYKAFSKLSTGEKNAVMMVILMNQGAFGPLIIDEPEQHLDVKSITTMLVPRMRHLKTRQQIICVTKDEHILTSGDAEQVIATQSEKSLMVITGDINNHDIQKQIMEIFEGNRQALLEKNRKLQRILEYSE